MKTHSVLCLGGLDLLGLSGLLVDARACRENGAACGLAVTAVVREDSRRVAAILARTPRELAADLAYLHRRLAPRALKIGMLANEKMVAACCRFLDRHPVRHVVLDPVLAASSGGALLTRAGWAALRRDLLPRVTVLTPNLPEAEALAGRRLASPAELEGAARSLRALGPQHVLIKGGHARRSAPDYLFSDRRIVILSGAEIRRGGRRATRRGTGCAFAAALAARLAAGDDVIPAARRAKDYVAGLLRSDA